VKIRLIPRKEIDEERWDQLIADSPAETLYPYTWYLDAVSEKWSAMVVEDYRFVMPVVWKKKAGMKYIYQPFYTQQLGVFSREYVDPELIRELLHILYKKFRFAGMNFNAKNLVGEEKHFLVDDKSNYVLKLDWEYERQHKVFSTNTKRNVRKSQEYDDLVDHQVPVQELVRLKRENDVIKRSEEDYRWLIKLFECIQDRGAGKIYAARKGDEVIAAAFFAFSKTRAIYLLSASSPRGKERRGMFRVVDAFIRDHARSGVLLDFEGSNIPSVARFFSGFGAQPEIYQGVSFSRLPTTLSKFR
jgi:Acetyltransferase (GNAT) domain